MDAKEKISKARSNLIMDHPFFGSIAIRMKLKEDLKCDTMWVDGKSLGYNPKFVDETSLENLIGTVAHEAMHVMLYHHTRRQGRDVKDWNKAADAAVNYILENAGFRLPPGAIRGINDSVENIYAKYPSSSDEPGCGEVRDMPGKDNKPASPAEIAQAESELRVMAAQAVQYAKSSGKMEGGLDRFVKEILEPKLDWRDLLRRFVDSKAKNDYQWTPPNRRFVHQGIYLPSQTAEELRNIVIGVDTSGSISDSDVAMFASEISAILEDFGATATVIYCDTKVRNVEVFSTEDLPLELHPKGGGGTSFIPPFEYVEENGIVPACFIYLTDMMCDKFPIEPDYPVLWVNTSRWKNYRVPFGEIINLGG